MRVWGGIGPPLIFFERSPLGKVEDSSSMVVYKLAPTGGLGDSSNSRSGLIGEDENRTTVAEPAVACFSCYSSGVSGSSES